MQTSSQGLAGQARYRLTRILGRHLYPWMLLAHANGLQTCAYSFVQNRILAILQRPVIDKILARLGLGPHPCVSGASHKPFEIPMCKEAFSQFDDILNMALNCLLRAMNAYLDELLPRLEGTEGAALTESFARVFRKEYAERGF